MKLKCIVNCDNWYYHISILSFPLSLFITAKVGIHFLKQELDSRLRGNDKEGRELQ